MIKKILKTDLIKDILEKNSNTPEVLLPYGLHCFGCAINIYESLEAGAKAHGFSDEMIDEIVAKLNEDTAKNESSA